MKYFTMSKNFSFSIGSPLLYLRHLQTWKEMQPEVGNRHFRNSGAPAFE